jgi:hypothetical protein
LLRRKSMPVLNEQLLNEELRVAGRAILASLYLPFARLR